MKLSVIGTGYLGAVHAACMAEIGHQVIGIDVDPAKIAALSDGRTPFYEPGLGDLLSRHVADGSLTFSTSLADAAAFADVHFVCVGTPQIKGSNAADMKYVDAVIDGLAPHLDRPCVVVGKSTSRWGLLPGSLSASPSRRRSATSPSWSGTRSSSVRATRSRRRSSPTASSSGPPRSTRTPCCVRSMPRSSRTTPLTSPPTSRPPNW